jgi:hypothetical protein
MYLFVIGISEWSLICVLEVSVSSHVFVCSGYQ